MNIGRGSAFVALAATALGGIVFLAPPPGARAQAVGQHDYIGAEQCRSCHEAEYEAWARGPHARAWDVLSAREKKDTRCVQCHTMAPDVLEATLVGVQCEACHGPGRYYASEPVMRDRELREALYLVVPDETTCARCHTETSPSLLPFRYEEKLEAIRHWK